MTKTILISLVLLATGFLSFSQQSDIRPKFRIGFDAPKIDHRQLLLTIDQRASYGIDWGFDALMYQVLADDMYWMLENKKYVIQAVDSLIFEKQIPLGVQTLTGGAITIKIDKLENVSEEMEIFLMDNETNILHDLRENNYTTTLAAGEYNNRYALAFKMKNAAPVADENAVLITEDIDAEFNDTSENLVADEPVISYPAIELYLNQTNRSITIKNPEMVAMNTVVLYSMMGQIMQTWETNTNTQNLTIPNMPKQGIYILHAYTENGKITKKIAIN
ncbi:MAG: T9SS type A sorting domain-containing protein [Lutibacter sp.]|nr:T9SS type A sorting domain-containing protein [Lutibacter sp.]